MKIRWLGHSSFLLTNEAGKQLVIDPYDPSTGYDFPENIIADVVVESHQHHDHNYKEAVSGNFSVIHTTGHHEIEGFCIQGIKTYHDTMMGEERGENIVFVIETDHVRVCHLGDLGHILSKEQVEAIGKVDVLLVPIGGTYTIDAKTAAMVCDEINAKNIVPMHYKTEVCAYDIASCDGFLKEMENREFAIVRLHSNTLEIDAENPSKRHMVYCMEYR